MSAGRGAAAAAGLLAVLLLAALWAPRHLPFVDLPQHAAQVAIRRGYADPSTGYARLYRPSPTALNALSHELLFRLAQVLGIPAALRALASLIALALPLATWWLLRRSGGDPRWALLVFPAALSWPLRHGFLAFSLAAPLVLVVLGLAAAYARAPSLGRALGLVAALHLVLFTHPIAWGYAGLAAAGLVALRAPGVAAAAGRLLPLLACLPVPAWWFPAISRHSLPALQTPPVWALGPGRLAELFGAVAGVELRLDAVVAGFLLLALPRYLGARPAREAARWAPFGVALLLFLTFPARFSGTAYLYWRFAVFLLPALLFALERDPGAEVPTRRWGLVAAGLALWLGAAGARFYAFGEATRGLDPVMAAAGRGRRVLYLPVDRRAEALGVEAFLHLGQWYQVGYDGPVDFSFAAFSVNPYAYRREALPPVPDLVAYRPGWLDWARHVAGRYDFLLVHAREDPRDLVTGGRPGRVEVAAREGAWWLLRVREAGAPPQPGV